MPKVCVIQCDGYDTNKVQKAVNAAFQEFHAEQYFKSGEKILLKPNLLSAKPPEKAVTTHPSVFRAVAVALKEYHVELSCGDSPGLDSTEKAMKISGIGEVANELGISPADFTGSFCMEYPQGKLTQKFQFVNAVRDNDGIVSIAKFKTHALTRFTGAMKNQFGLIPGTLKAKEHVRFPNSVAFSLMLSDLNKCVRPRLFIMDAIVGMEGNGPANGNPKEINRILISDDPVALDSVCAGMAGLDYKTVPTVRAGGLSGLGTADPHKIDLCLMTGENDGFSVRWDKADKMIPLLRIPNFVNAVENNKARNLMKKIVGPFVKKMGWNRPSIIESRCTKCKVCVSVCPLEPKAIEFSEEQQKIIYHYDRCIRCFCCQELCPGAAIEIRNGKK